MILRMWYQRHEVALRVLDICASLYFLATLTAPYNAMLCALTRHRCFQAHELILIRPPKFNIYYFRHRSFYHSFLSTHSPFYLSCSLIPSHSSLVTSRSIHTFPFSLSPYATLLLPPFPPALLFTLYVDKIELPLIF